MTSSMGTRQSSTHRGQSRPNYAYWVRRDARIRIARGLARCKFLVKKRISELARLHENGELPRAFYSGRANRLVNIIQKSPQLALTLPYPQLATRYSNVKLYRSDLRITRKLWRLIAASYDFSRILNYPRLKANATLNLNSLLQNVALKLNIFFI